MAEERDGTHTLDAADEKRMWLEYDEPTSVHAAMPPGRGPCPSIPNTMVQYDVVAAMCTFDENDDE